MQRHNNAIQEFFADLGPGLITGAADDDPSGITAQDHALIPIDNGPAYFFPNITT